MKKALLSLFTIFAISFVSQVFGQGMVNVYIQPSGSEGIDTVYLEDKDDVVYDTVIVNLSSDDAEQEDDAMDDLFDDDLDIGWEGEPDKKHVLTLGMRFQNIIIPQNATIDSAFILIYAHDDKYAEDTAKITIYADASDNAPTFTEDSLITDRTATSSTVKWVVNEDWSRWTEYSSPDLKTIVQEIVDRSGWASGNSIAFIMAGEEGEETEEYENAREFESYENIADPEDEGPDGTYGDGKNHTDRVPRLVVYYDGYQVSGIATTTSESNLQVYPNIASNGTITVSFGENTASNINIFNNLGQLVKSYSSINSGSTLNVNDLSNGMYFINVKTNTGSSTSRFIKK